MGREARENEKGRMLVLESMRGHDSTVAHTFNHTGGLCPKCGSNQQHIFFCLPGGGGAALPYVRTCELDGEHLHRLCAVCSYPWIERTMDQAMLAEREGTASAESELAAALVVILERTEGAVLDQQLLSSRRNWTIRFTRDSEQRTLTLTVGPPKPQTGTPVHPQMPQEGAPA